jgi:transcriptional regulator GlxA family with amidase domain
MRLPRNCELPTRFGFLLLNDFTLISLSSAVEPLRMANRICRSDVYSWTTISETGKPVTASDGLSINVDYGIESNNVLDDLDTLIVCGGIGVSKNTNTRILKSLKTANQQGLALGSICTGSYALAKAGLLDGFHCSIHWENMAALADLFPRIVVDRSIFTIDRNRCTSSGGTAPVDMMLHFISLKCGVEVSAGVAEQFIYERIRQADENQRVPLRNVIGHQSRKLVTAIELMESNIREPLNQQDLAAYVALSGRQLQRLFKRYMSCTPSTYYLQLRLQRARELLRQTSMSLTEITTMTGFVSTSHFSKSYRKYFGYSPINERR